MSNILQDLDRIKGRISDPSFLNNKGLSNEVGIHVFCYDPADEIIVQDYVRRLKAEANTPYHIVECDLYEISSGTSKLVQYVNQNYIGGKTDMFAIFIERAAQFACFSGFVGMITQE